MIVLAIALALGLLCLLKVGGFKTAPGGLPLDENGTSVQEYKRMEYQDAHATPKISPYSLTTTPTLITIPTGARALIAKGSGTWRYGNNATLDGTGAGKGYKTGEAGVDVIIPVTQTLSETDGTTAIVLYAKGDSGTITLDFAFAF